MSTILTSEIDLEVGLERGGGCGGKKVRKG